MEIAGAPCAITSAFQGRPVYLADTDTSIDSVSYKKRCCVHCPHWFSLSRTAIVATQHAKIYTILFNNRARAKLWHMDVDPPSNLIVNQRTQHATVIYV